MATYRVKRLFQGGVCGGPLFFSISVQRRGSAFEQLVSAEMRGEIDR